MTKPTGTDPLSMAIARCMMLLANCDSVQSFLGASDADEAYPRIHDTDIEYPAATQVTWTKDELEELRPFITVEMDVSQGFRSVRTATDGVFNDGGRLQVMFERSLASGDSETLATPKNAVVNMREEIGEIIAEMWEKHEQAADADHDYLSLQSINLFGPLVSNHKEASESGEYVVAWLDIIYGNQQ